MSPISSTSPIFLAGFMASGKSTIGQLVADALGRPFLDLDAEIEKRENKSISALFSENGEAYFRDREAHIAAELAQREGLVLALGGGTLVRASTRELLQQRGLIVTLRTQLDAIVERTQNNHARPLLTKAPDRSEVERLFNARKSLYRALPIQISSTNRSPEACAERIVRIVSSAQELGPFNYIDLDLPGDSYPIWFTHHGFRHIPMLLETTGLDAQRILVVTDDNVGPLYADQLRNAFRADTKIAVHTLPHGEAHKTLESVHSIYEALLAHHANRHTLVIALGGGVIGDMAGFAASTFMRGLPFVQIPTTVLSMVDSSVGGKNGVDLPQGKNLVGTFTQPRAVFIDTGCLETLPEAERRAGMAEVLKHGMIDGADLFHAVQSHGTSPPMDIIRQALLVKVDVVERDPFEQNERAYLNLGHTFGHALELVSDFQLSHGEAVGLGLLASAHLAVTLFPDGPNLIQTIHDALSKLGLPTRCPAFPMTALIDALGKDKKRIEGQHRFIVPRQLGHIQIALLDDTSAIESAFAHITEPHV